MDKQRSRGRNAGSQVNTYQRQPQVSIGTFSHSMWWRDERASGAVIVNTARLTPAVFVLSGGAAVPVSPQRSGRSWAVSHRRSGRSRLTPAERPFPSHPGGAAVPVSPRRRPFPSHPAERPFPSHPGESDRSRLTRRSGRSRLTLAERPFPSHPAERPFRTVWKLAAHQTGSCRPSH